MEVKASRWLNHGPIPNLFKEATIHLYDTIIPKIVASLSLIKAQDFSCEAFGELVHRKGVCTPGIVIDNIPD